MMRVKNALNDYRRHTEARTRFPGERRTTTGRFSGLDTRLVHIDLDGSLRDFSYPLTGLTGIARSRFGFRPTDSDIGATEWLDAERSSQRYHDHTALVITDHDTPFGRVRQFDITLDTVHITHFEGRTDTDSIELVVDVEFAPDGRSQRIGQLHHGDAAEVYHAAEVDYIASAPSFETMRGVPFGGFETFLDESATGNQQDALDDSTGEDLLSGGFVGVVPFDGAATLATLLTTRSTHSRAEALKTVRGMAREHDSVSLTDTATAQPTSVVENSHPHAETIAADLRVLSLLSGRTGLRIAGPDFDPYYAHSGGYGYCWFRDDAEISRLVLETDRHVGLGLEEWHDRSAGLYRETQREDGTWPHRVWPFDASLAPGWANARLTTGDDVAYQADQTGSVASFLASVDGDTDRLERTLDGLDATLGSDGRPVACQNVWENMSGRFTHTTATVLEAYSRLAASNATGISDRATRRATTVYRAVDDLWVEQRGCYALREYGAAHENAGTLDDRCDSATFALVSAHRAYDRVGVLDDRRLDRLVSHVETITEELTQEGSKATGLIRYEGDEWRQRGQGREKIWTVSTAWGAYAGALLAGLLDERDDGRAGGVAATAGRLLDQLLPGGSLCIPGGYLPEQVFDDGTPDSATPLGWSHALRLRTIGLLDEIEHVERTTVSSEE